MKEQRRMRLLKKRDMACNEEADKGWRQRVDGEWEGVSQTQIVNICHIRNSIGGTCTA